VGKTYPSPTLSSSRLYLDEAAEHIRNEFSGGVGGVSVKETERCPCLLKDNLMALVGFQ